MNSEKLKFLRAAFQAEFQTLPQIFRAPGRVNLIGEHTDYNDGFVMPAAINFATYVAATPREDRFIHVTSQNLHDSFQFDPDAATPLKNWTDYVQGVAVALKEFGCELRGANLLLESDVPMGAGLSSSAALEVAVAYALLAVSKIELEPLQIAKICQRAENNFVGMNCGLMDQFISCYGQENHAVMLDCLTLESKALPLPGDVRLVVCNTMVKHELANSAYNERRADCEAAAKLLGIQSLRDIGSQEFMERAEQLPLQLRKRARHVITENERVQQAASALLQNELMTFGQFMNASHESLREDYEVSCDELDLMVDLARHQRGVYGARMTGGGFGGCTINLVDAESVDQFRKNVAEAYEAATSRIPDIYVCQAVRGADEIVPASGF